MRQKRDAKVSAKAEMMPKILGYWQSSMDEKVCLWHYKHGSNNRRLDLGSPKPRRVVHKVSRDILKLLKVAEALVTDVSCCHFIPGPEVQN